MLWYGLAPASPIDDRLVLWSLNVYSENDSVTGWIGQSCKNLSERFGKEVLNGKEYNIKILPSSSGFINRNFSFIEHSFHGPTLQKELNKGIDGLRDKYGFYKEVR
jgi:endo-1,4-beta-D-glucanase Y